MKRRSQAQWRALFQQQQRSGQTAAVFCRSQGLCPKYFSLRRRQLLGEVATVDTVPAFVPVAMPRPLEAPTLELRLGESLQLRVPGSVPAAWLAELLHALRS